MTRIKDIKFLPIKRYSLKIVNFFQGLYSKITEAIAQGFRNSIWELSIIIIISLWQFVLFPDMFTSSINEINMLLWWDINNFEGVRISLSEAIKLSLAVMAFWYWYDLYKIKNKIW